MINKISNWEDSLNQNAVDTSSTESDLLLEQKGLKDIQWEKNRQKNQDLNQADDLLSQLQDRTTPEQMIQMTNFYDKILDMIDQIELTSASDYNDHYKKSDDDRLSSLWKRMEKLIEIFDSPDVWNFLQNKELWESIWIKNQIRWTFHYGIDNLLSIYNDKELIKDKKSYFYQINANVVFLKSLLNRNIKL